MNICYINPTNNIRRPIAELAGILSKEGHHVSVMYPVSKECPTKNWVANDAIKNGKIKLIPIKSWYFSALRYNFPNLFQLYKETKKIYKRNDKVHIWEYYYPLFVVPLLYSVFNKKNKNKIILTTDGFVGYSYKPKKPRWLVPAFRLYTQLFARFLFKIPKSMTTYGKSMLPYAKQAGVPMRKLKVIPTGIHLERFQNVAQEKVDELRKEFEIDKEKVILFVGMLTERKGVNKVIDVSQKLLEEGFHIKTLIVGDAHGENVYKKAVRLEFQDKILFVGGRKDIPELMHMADVLLLPSEGEGLPGVVMEAMACGLPVVATKEGCTPDLIEDGKEGFLVDGGNYLNKIKILLDCKEICRKSSNNSKDKIKKNPWKIVLGRYKELYGVNI